MVTNHDSRAASGRRRALLALLALGALAQGCVSTEALYAEYDERACRVAVESVPGGETIVREIATDRSMHWEPMVGFGFDDAALDELARRRLDRDAEVLRAFPELNVVVRGFTDAIGPVDHNRALAARRVESVIAYLREQGIDGERFGEVSFGEGLPLVTRGRQKRIPVNRRVELLLTDADGIPVPLRVRPLEPDAAEVDADVDGGSGDGVDR